MDIAVAGEAMANKSNNNGCGLAAICLLIILAVSKCGGGTTPTAVQDAATSQAPATSPSSETTPMYVATATLNCRAEPTSNASVVEKLSSGDAVMAGETRGTWVSLERPGHNCWTALRFLSENQPEAEPVRLLSPPRDPLESVSSRRSGPSCGTKWKCGQMDSCAEAQHYLNDCGVGRLDGDGDGVPCESIC